MDSNKESIYHCDNSRNKESTYQCGNNSNKESIYHCDNSRNKESTCQCGNNSNKEPICPVIIAEIRTLLVSVTIAVIYCFHKESYTVDYKFSEEVQTDNHDFHDQI